MSVIIQEELETQREEIVAKSIRHEAEVAQLAFRLSDVEARRYQNAEQIGLVFQQKEAMDVGKLIIDDVSCANRIDCRPNWSPFEPLRSRAQNNLIA